MKPVLRLLGAAIIAAVTGAVYFPSLGGDFNLDDNIYLTSNRLIAAPDGLFRFWFTREAIDYYPVSNTTLWLEWRLWGASPAPYRITNIVLHVASALLVWMILAKLAIPGAFLAALLFTVHPVNVEAVAWIAQRKDVLALFFCLLSLLLYLLSEHRRTNLKRRDKTAQRRGQAHFAPRTAQNEPDPVGFVPRVLETLPNSEPRKCRAQLGWYFLSLLAFLLAMLSKGSIAVLPLVLLLIAWWQQATVTTRDILRTAPFFCIAIVLTIVHIWSQTRGSGEILRHATLAQRIAGAGAVPWFYLGKAILPLHLLFVYPQWSIEIANWRWWLPAIAAIGSAALLWNARTNSTGRALLFAWAFFCIALAPVFGFTDVGFMRYSLVADHYQHLAVIAVAGLFAAGWSCWSSGSHVRRRTFTLGAAIVVATLAYLCFQQNVLYGNLVELYETSLASNPNCWMIHNNLGSVLKKQGKTAEAMAHYQAALRLSQDYADAHYNMGTLLKERGDADQAIEQFKRAIQLNPMYASAHYNMANLLVSAGRLPEAIEQYVEALKTDPEAPDIHNNLGAAYETQGRLPEALEQYQEALKCNPNFADAQRSLGGALLKSGQLQEAIEHLKRAVELDPDDAKSFFTLGVAYSQAGQPKKAEEFVTAAAKLARQQGNVQMAQQIEAWVDQNLRGNQPK